MAQGAAAKPKEATKVATPPGTAKATPAKKSPGWSVRCDNPGKKLQCKAFQNVFMQKTGQLFLSVSVSQPEKEKNGAMMLQLPLGLFNPAGVTVSIDGGKAETFPIQTCDKSGCFAGAPIPPEKLTELTKGQKLTVVFENLQKKKITVGVPLNGFGEAYKKL